MSDDAYYHYPPFQPKTDQVMALNLVGENDSCGCAATCGCTPNVAKIPKQYNIPQEAKSLIHLEDLNLFVDEVNRILERTFIPMLPMSFLHFCLPFSPICIMSRYRAKRQKDLNLLLEAKNATMKDCHWELNTMAFHYQTYPVLSLISHTRRT
eukprot:CAMPEP_0173150556 /NCGR_PEP_ID=MMETSP1105-20130129/11036_1 /TAXON_ID=2985 /ORGANISM="Ochromonas sp., Strain BG-1" /LENGTH=152 /DNA_ID=CAMNT_0014065725 /DNA_START=95 /DNA_END=553 /DNA_ORIENTATION=-